MQEEVGIHGAQTSATMIQPDVYIALDVTCAMDTPGVEAKDDDPKVGLGPVIINYDSGLITNTKLRDLFIDTAEEEGIPYQTEVCIYDGGTDAESAHVTGYGVPSINIGFATSYIHSHASVIHLDDLENTVKLLTAVLKKLDQKQSIGSNRKFYSKCKMGVSYKSIFRLRDAPPFLEESIWLGLAECGRMAPSLRSTEARSRGPSEPTTIQ